MFNPSRQQVRNFFLEAWKKQQKNSVLSELESIAVRWIKEHPEYHSLLQSTTDSNEYIQPAFEQENPFLHLSMHLAITEQIQANQPIGITQIYKKLCVQEGTEHQASHIIMECLGQVLWTAQRNQASPDNKLYLECLNKKLVSIQ